MPEPVKESSARTLTVQASLLEGPQHTVLEHAAGDSVAVAADEQCSSCRPRPDPDARASTLRVGGEPDSTGGQIAFHNRDQALFHRDSPILVALTADLDDAATLGGGADVTDVGVKQLVGPQSRQHRAQHQCRVAFGP